MGATTTSGLTVTYKLSTATTNDACAVSEYGVVTVLAVGTCAVTAMQDGTAQIAPASKITKLFQVVPSTPTAPFMTSASASDQSITLAFTSPGFDGGETPSAYMLVATPVGGGTPITASDCTASPCTISGLTNGTSYVVTVAAINSAGVGSTSRPSGAMTPIAAAAAVGALTAMPGDATVTVSWTPLSDEQLDTDTFIEYQVSYRVRGTSTWTTWSDPAFTTRGTSSTVITGLDNGTNYDFKVVALTSGFPTASTENTANAEQYPSTVPDAPRSLTALRLAQGSVQVSWEAPISDGGSPLIDPYYTIVFTPTTRSDATVTCEKSNATYRFCTASSLVPGVKYTISVTDVNRMGTSEAATTTYPVITSGRIGHAAFFTARSSTFSPSGKTKLRAIVKAVPKLATNTQVQIIGASVALHSMNANIDLASARAKKIAKFLRKRHVPGTYTLSITTRFIVGGRLMTKVIEGPGQDQPWHTANGKPLTTARASYSISE